MNDTCPDFEQIVEKARNYTSQIGGHEPLEVQSSESVRHVMEELVFRLEDRGIKQSKCMFWIHPEVSHELLEQSNPVHLSKSSLKVWGGQPIIERSLPEGHILYAAPNAIGLGGKIYNPRAVAYAQLHDIHPEKKNEFDEKWERFVEIADDIDQSLGLDYEYADAEDRKEHVRELWLDNKVTFTAGVPVIQSDTIHD